MDKKDVIDLSQRMIPGKEKNFELKVRIFDTNELLPQLKHSPDAWYIMGEVTYCTHNGTHIEVPFHHLKDGLDTADFPVHKLIGNCVVLDFTYKKPGEKITVEELKKYDDLINENDIVFLRSGMDRNFRTDHWIDMPELSEEAHLWLVKKGIACLGTDAAGLETTQGQPGHIALFEANIPIVESLTNLDKVKNGKYE